MGEILDMIVMTGVEDRACEQFKKTSKRKFNDLIDVYQKKMKLVSEEEKNG